MAKAPHPAADLALKEQADDEDENLGHHGPKDRDLEAPEVETALPGHHDLTDEDLDPGWSTMASAPMTGKPVQLVGLVGGVPVYSPAYMHNSRRYTGSASRWVDFAEWRILNSPERVPFEPLAWTRYE